MRLPTIALGCVVSMFWWAGPLSALAQEPDISSDGEWTSFARAYIAITDITAELQAELALPENKSEEAQTRIREAMRRRIQETLQAHDLTETRYAELNFVISTSDERRDAFTTLVEELSAEEDGAPAR